MIPVAFSFLLIVCWLIDVYRIHSQIGMVVDEAGLQMVNYSYTYETIASGVSSKEEVDELIKIASSVIFTKAYLEKKIKASGAYSQIEGMKCAVDLVSEKDSIILTAIYRVKPPVSIKGLGAVTLKNSFYAKSFLGYEISDESDEYVFVTKNSEVYHCNRQCSSINTTVNTVYESEIEKKRNKDGSKYYQCSKCKGTKNSGKVFITPYGNRYHNKADCKELKVSVYRIPLAEVGGRRKCYFCG